MVNVKAPPGCRLLELDEPLKAGDLLDWCRNGTSWTSIKPGSTLIGETRTSGLSMIGRHGKERKDYPNDRAAVARREPEEEDEK